MYNIAVFSVENILVLMFTKYSFFRISVVNILVLICTTYPFFPCFYSKHTSFNMYKIPFFRISVVNILFFKALHGRLAGRFKPPVAGRCNDFAPSRQKNCHRQKQPSRPGPRKKKKNTAPSRPVEKKKNSHPVPPRKKKTTAPSRLEKKKNRPVPP